MILTLPQTTSHSSTRSSSKPDETTKRFLNLRCHNRSTTISSSSTLCATTNRHTNYLSSTSNSLLMAASCHQQATHLKVHFKDRLKASHPRHTSLTPHQTYLNNKTRSATSPQDHLQSNQRSQASVAPTLSNQHRLTDRLPFTSSQAASKTNHSHPNPQS